MFSLKETLSRTREAFRRVGDAFRSGRSREEVLSNLEEALILADVGIPTVEKILGDLRAKSLKDAPPDRLRGLLRDELLAILRRGSGELRVGPGPTVILGVGVNGGGKTTTLAKLAFRFKSRGLKVMMAAGDTFRAAAQEQLALWGKRLNVPVVRGSYGADPAAVVFDAVASFKAQGLDLLLVDTAGRLHTNVGLMNELEKVRRVVARELPGEPRETLLILDATIGQNAVVQAREFLKVSGLTGIVLTKLDGSAKGGSVIGIADELSLPIKFIGLGESEEDLAEFDAAAFVDALLT